MPNGRYLMSAEKVGGLIYIMRGLMEDFSSVAVVYAFNPADSTFQPRKALPKPLAAMATAVFGGNIYLLGGIPWSQ